MNYLRMSLLHSKLSREVSEKAVFFSSVLSPRNQSAKLVLSLFSPFLFPIAQGRQGPQMDELSLGASGPVSEFLMIYISILNFIFMIWKALNYAFQRLKFKFYKSF